MRTEFRLHEGSSIIRFDGLPVIFKWVLATPGRLRRSPLATVGDAFRGLFHRLEASAYRMRYRELERYLADSCDVVELERRMRHIERRSGAGFNPYF